MANAPGAWYDPLWYANEILEVLEKVLGLAARVHRGYDKDPQQRGSTIQIRRPGSFTAQNAPSSVQDLTPTDVAITLDKWKEVKFAITDKELSEGQEVFIQDHIRPAAVAIADQIDQDLALAYLEVPWIASATAPAAVADITGVKQILFDNKAPMFDQEMLHFMVNSQVENELTQLQTFSQFQGAGASGEATQLSGQLGRRYGFNFFANQNVQTHTSGTSADATGALVGAHAKGVTSISLDGTTASGTFKKGDTLVIAGNTQRYAITADATESSGVTLAITPALVQAHADNDVVTIDLTSGAVNLAFHRNFAALAMAPLSDMANELGARVETIVDPISNLSLRSRMFYIGDTSKVYVAVDVLYGVQVLDNNLAVRLYD